ncbi:MAG: molybdopterin-dependent oxidoreductase [Deltaproteobacteria bacterium]|nr:molybdopterin-dependent oxidoreductase [Deltaproteobacteria bacterium]
MPPQTEQVVRSACRGCHGVCQVLVHLREGRVVRVTGDPASPTSRGYLCPKGAAAPELLYHPDRLTRPLRRVGQRGEGRWRPVTWAEALGEMAERFGGIKDESGAEFLAIMQGTGRPYSEFTLRFANAFGTPNFVSPGHLCYLPRVIASQITLGGLPVADIYGQGGQMPRTVLLWGCNITATGAADGMCGNLLARALQQAERVMVVDPRRIGPTEKARPWLALRPGSDLALALAMLHVIITEDLFDHDFVTRHCHGFAELAAHVAPCTPAWAAGPTWLDPADIRAAARALATERPACLQWGNGVDTQPHSFQAARALLLLLALTGNLDVPGGNVLWVPPAGVRPKSPLIDHSVAGDQFLPPEQKARMIGAGDFPFAPGAHPPTFWQAVATGDPYRVRGLWVVGSNPLSTATQGELAARGLRDYLEFTVVSDFFLTPTAELADLVLPAATWLEQDDVVSLHKVWCVLARRQVAQVGEVRDDRDVILDLAHHLGLHEAFPWPDRQNYLAWLLEPGGWSFAEFCELGIVQGEMRYRKYEEAGFPTPTGKFELFSTIMAHAGASPLPVFRGLPGPPEAGAAGQGEYPLILVSGCKQLHFFHSEGRQLASLRKAHPEPRLDLHPATAAGLGLAAGDWARVETPHGRAWFRVRLSEGLDPRVVHAEHAWWFPERPGPGHGWRESNVNLLFGQGPYDPETGAEPLKCYWCRVRKGAGPAN